MKKTLFLLLLIASILPARAQKKTSDTTRYPVTFQFASYGTGVPDDQPLKDYINTFKKRNRIKSIPALRVGPMGREGEYYLLFTLKGMKKKIASLFIGGLQQLAEQKPKNGLWHCVKDFPFSESQLAPRAKIKKVDF